MMPVGNGLLNRLNGVTEPSLVPTNGVVYALTGSLFGLMLKATSLGIQKMPYPVRTTVLLLSRYAKPRRGAARLWRSMLLRLRRSGEVTRPDFPFGGQAGGPGKGVIRDGVRRPLRAE